MSVAKITDCLLRLILYALPIYFNAMFLQLIPIVMIGNYNISDLIKGNYNNFRYQSLNNNNL